MAGEAQTTAATSVDTMTVLAMLGSSMSLCSLRLPSLAAVAIHYLIYSAPPVVSDSKILQFFPDILGDLIHFLCYPRSEAEFLLQGCRKRQQ